MKGEDFNPSQSPFDPELVMLSGDGRKHGHIIIGYGLIRYPRSLLEIKKRQTKSLPEMGEGVLDKGVSGQPDYILWPY